MLDVLRLLCALIWSRCKPQAARVAENLVLRQQLVILRRAAPKRIQLRQSDRLILVWLYRLFPSVPPASADRRTIAVTPLLPTPVDADRRRAALRRSLEQHGSRRFGLTDRSQFDPYANARPTSPNGSS